MGNLFKSVATTVVTAALVLTGAVLPAVSASGEVVDHAAPVVAGLDRQAISGPGFTPPPAPDAKGMQVLGSWVGPYTYRNQRAGKCLDILGASLDSLAPAVQYNCVAGGRSQMWWDYIYEQDGFGYSRLLGNNYSGKCLHVDGKNIPIKQVGCAILPNQLFDTTSVNPQLLQNYYGCMEIAGGSPENFARIVTWNCHSMSHQIWYKYAI